MKTITFYSYKGGVGRSLALVNIATRLAEFGKRVCVLDFDLEAPGLHYKFPIYRDSNLKKGIVDYIYSFTNSGILENSIKDYSIEFQLLNNTKPITLIPAGNTDSEHYWKKLSAINWYNLMYENPNGLAFFLNLKEKIKNEINPDFLLIDSRTGISETSGITLSLLAEEVVIVAANNKENLNGASKIIKSLNNPENNIIGIKPKITFVLSRIPFTDKPEDRNRELLLLNKIKRNFLSPYISEINIIHSDRELELEERVKIAHEKEESVAQISLDYLKLFEKLTENDLTLEEIERFNNIKESEKLFNKAINSNNQINKINLINDAISLNKSNIDFYLYRASIYFDFKKFSDSIADLEYILSKKPNSIDASLMLVDNYIQSKNYSKAETYLENLLNEHSSNIDVLLKKIIILIRTNKFEEAEEYSSKIIEKDPELSLGYSCRGDIRRRLKKFEDAFKDIYIALELNSENSQALATLAEIHAELGNINEFYIFFENALKNDRYYIQDCIHDEDIYKEFYNDERFINLLNKYGVII